MDENKYVSRGGLKLEEALEKFKLNVSDKICLDIGSSTGGFVDCLLKHGAKQVVAVDTSYGELNWRLRNDPQVVVLERQNALHLNSLSKKNQSNGPERVDLITIDAGWTRLSLILPVIKRFLSPHGMTIALLKPHYEADKNLLTKGVLAIADAEIVRDRVLTQIKDLGFEVLDICDSPILGGGGNKEYLILLRLATS